MPTDPSPLPQRAILGLEEAQRMVQILREQSVTQLPFSLVAANLVECGLAFYPDETVNDTTRTIALLRKLVRHGKLAGVAPVRGSAGTCDLEDARLLAARFRQARQPVEGRGILATAVPGKYGFSDPSVYRWYESGWVHVVNVEDGNRMFNEGDIAMARAIADLIGHKPGKAVFPTRNPSGRPPKAPDDN